MSNTANVIFVVEQVTAQKLKQNFIHTDPNDLDSPYVRNELSNNARKKLLANYSGRWKTIDIGGTNYIPISFHIPAIPVSDEDNKLKWLEHLLALFPGKITVVAVFKYSDGAHYGQTVVPATSDSEGVELTPETITGNAIYPQHARALDIMPNGVFEEVHNILGAAPRRWV